MDALTKSNKDLKKHCTEHTTCTFACAQIENNGTSQLISEKKLIQKKILLVYCLHQH